MANNQRVIDQLKKLGFNEKEAQIYLILLQKGVLTPLKLSRFTKINRTTIYRVLEKLKEAGAVEEVLEQKSTKFQAGSPEKLNMLLTKKEVELAKIKQILPNIIANLSVIEDTTLPPLKLSTSGAKAVSNNCFGIR
jgi:sugar-specific transcriptional regulator TrmB